MERFFRRFLLNVLKDAVGEPIKSVQPTSGKSSYTAIINHAYVVKFPYDVLSAEKIQKEINISDILQQYPLPAQTPQWQYKALSDAIVVNRDFCINFCAVSPIVDGVHPLSLDTPALAEDLGKFFAAVHCIPSSAFKNVPTYLDKEFDDIVSRAELRMIYDGGTGLSDSQWKQFKRQVKNTVFVSTNNGFLSNVRPVLSHLDIHPLNVLVNKQNRLCAVLDFGNALLTPMADDVFSLSVRLFDNGDELESHYQKNNPNYEMDAERARATNRIICQVEQSVCRQLKHFVGHHR